VSHQPDSLTQNPKVISLSSVERVEHDLAYYEGSRFFRIGRTEIEQRHLAVVPLKLETKTPKRFHDWNHNPITTISELMLFTPYHYDSNAGVVGTSGVGNLMVVDLDQPGVEERIVRECLRRMPVTYTVQSQRTHKPFKKHFYFWQTAYSVSMFKGLEKNVQDILVSDEMLATKLFDAKFTTIFDCKGCGGGGQVAAAGSVHPSGSIYTAMTDVVIIPIPNWLVDWLCRDSTAYRSVTAKFAVARKKARDAGDQTAKPVADEDIYKLVRSSSGYLAIHGIDRDLIEINVLRLIEKWNGKDKAQSESVKELVHNAAYDKRLKIGIAPNFKLRFGKQETNADGTRSFRTAVPSPYRSTRLVQLLNTFPDMLADSEAKRLIKEIWPEYDQDDNAHRVALHRARRQAGFTLTDDELCWIRLVPLFVSRANKEVK